MKKQEFIGEQIPMNVVFPSNKRDVKGYVAMVKAQREEMGMTPKRKAYAAPVKNKPLASKDLMWQFIRNTLPAKMKVIPERVSFIIEEDKAVCDLYVKHPSILGAGQVRYVFEREKCVYYDWFGDVIDYSQSWTDFQERREEKEI